MPATGLVFPSPARNTSLTSPLFFPCGEAVSAGGPASVAHAAVPRACRRILRNQHRPAHPDRAAGGLFDLGHQGAELSLRGGGPGRFVLSWLTLPVFYLLSFFLFALPLFIMIPLVYLAVSALAWPDSRPGVRRKRFPAAPASADGQSAGRGRSSPAGILHALSGETWRAAGATSEQRQQDRSREIRTTITSSAVSWKLGRLAAGARTVRGNLPLNPDYGLGDIFREVGKAYLHTGKAGKAIEFLVFPRTARVGPGRAGTGWRWRCKIAGATRGNEGPAATLLEQARSNPRFFRRENREWIYRAGPPRSDRRRP